MARNPEWYANRATTREGFVEFLRVLQEDREEAEEAARFAPPGGFDVPPGGWGSWTIGEFLAGMELFMDIVSSPEQPNWEFLARLLIGGKQG